MKPFMFFIALFSLLLVNTNAQLTCEQHFNTPVCNECQTELWNSSGNQSTTCTFYGNLFMEYQQKPFTYDYNMTSFDNLINELCSSEFTCTYEESKQIWGNIMEKCANELSTYVDWSAAPSTLEQNQHSVIASYGSLFFFYFAVPEHNSICYKSSSGEFCGVESIKPVIDWLKQEVPEGNIQISYDHQFVYKEDGTSIKIPTELLTSCGECGVNMINEYENWIDQYGVPDPIVKNVFGGSLDALKVYSSCPLVLFS
ncbi:hypothetical protein RclHR1_06440009 [Rhizophagus clarus]|uniref:Uncharacterized protein n=1 Tax=Rhizophagus clarus TaxID=94130 RepID=A0A2Z6S9Y7_9GLOM|nr:hypothetical protein RclHR1_06440009 [Rhizophagus clarus]GES81600.1 hypothetical protein GLOIN_2v1474176 [Rhizophagus clarus]